MQGLDLVDYRKRFGADLRDKYSTEVARLSEAGLIEIDQDLMRLTRRGALLSNEVFAALA
jgi:oxygen-independent coproporphyrinogen-3 oxidase